MRPRIYKDKAAKQAEYREAKKLGMTCAEYRAHIAAGGKPAPETEGNHGWDMLWAARARKADMEESKTACHGCGYKRCACAEIAKRRAAKVTTPITSPVAAPKLGYGMNPSHVIDPNDSSRLLCGKRSKGCLFFVEGGVEPTCARCLAKVTQPVPVKPVAKRKAKVTKPETTDPRPVILYSECPVHIATRCGMNGDKRKALCGASGLSSLSTVEPEYMESHYPYNGKHIRILVNKPQPNCPACFAKAEANKAKRSAKVTQRKTTLDAVNAMAASIYPSLEDTTK
jgi:hypothetical protein